MTYSQYYAQFVKEYEHELGVMLTSYPKGDLISAEVEECRDEKSA